MRVNFYDAASAPGWHDYLGLLLGVVGFGIAIWQIIVARKESTKARLALEQAQRHLSQNALMSLVPQLQTISHDLDFALPAGNIEVAKRALVRFGLLASEAEALLVSIPGDHTALKNRFRRHAIQATRVKGEIVSIVDPDLTHLAKTVAVAIESLNKDLAGVVSSLRNTVEGMNDV